MKLPDDLLEEIIAYLSTEDRFNLLRAVCHASPWKGLALLLAEEPLKVDSVVRCRHVAEIAKWVPLSQLELEVDGDCELEMAALADMPSVKLVSVAYLQNCARIVLIPSAWSVTLMGVRASVENLSHLTVLALHGAELGSYDFGTLKLRTLSLSGYSSIRLGLPPSLEALDLESISLLQLTGYGNDIQELLIDDVGIGADDLCGLIDVNLKLKNLQWTTPVSTILDLNPSTDRVFRSGLHLEELKVNAFKDFNCWDVFPMLRLSLGLKLFHPRRLLAESKFGSELRVLTLDEADFESLPSFPEGLQELALLDLFVRLPLEFSHDTIPLPSGLRLLTIRGSCIHSIILLPSGIECCDFRNNALERVSTLATNVRLRELNVAGNLIRSLVLLAPLIVAVDASDNRVTNLQLPSSIRRLNLAYNPIKLVNAALDWCDLSGSIEKEVSLNAMGRRLRVRDLQVEPMNNDHFWCDRLQLRMMSEEFSLNLLRFEAIRILTLVGQFTNIIIPDTVVELKVCQRRNSRAKNGVEAPLWKTDLSCLGLTLLILSGFTIVNLKLPSLLEYCRLRSKGPTILNFPVGETSLIFLLFGNKDLLKPKNPDHVWEWATIGHNSKTHHSSLQSVEAPTLPIDLVNHPPLLVSVLVVDRRFYTNRGGSFYGCPPFEAQYE